MFGTVHILSVDLRHTTAMYFKNVLATKGIPFRYWSNIPDVSDFNKSDLFIAIDPLPSLPLAMEVIPCLSAIYFIDVHQSLQSRLRLSRFFDVSFIAQRDYVQYFSNIGSNSHWLPLACDPAVHYQRNLDRIYDVGFVGKFGDIGSWRNQILTNVLRQFNTNSYELFVDPKEMGKIYSQSKIVFNASIGKELNMRFFEALASGALLVTDRIPEALGNLFTEGVHYVGYSDEKEAIKKINFYLNNSKERERIAREGQRVALAGHSYKIRWDYMSKAVNAASKDGAMRSMDKVEISASYAAIFADLAQPLEIWRSQKRYGFNSQAMKSAIIATGRKINSRIPITPRAIKNRFSAYR